MFAWQPCFVNSGHALSLASSCKRRGPFIFCLGEKKDTPEKKIATQQDIDEVRNSCQEQKDVGNDVEHRASKHRYSTNILGYLQHDRTE